YAGRQRSRCRPRDAPGPSGLCVTSRRRPNGPTPGERRWAPGARARPSGSAGEGLGAVGDPALERVETGSATLAGLLEGGAREIDLTAAALARGSLARQGQPQEVAGLRDLQRIDLRPGEHLDRALELGHGALGLAGADQRAGEVAQRDAEVGVIGAD